MGYADQRYYSRALIPWGFAISLSTSTASATDGHDLSDVMAGLPKLQRKTKVTALRLRCTTIADTGSTGLVGHLMNGTTTAATVILTTLTADEWASGTVAASSAVFSADVEPTFSLTGTSTASGDANGSYDIWIESDEEYSA